MFLGVMDGAGATGGRGTATASGGRGLLIGGEVTGAVAGPDPLFLAFGGGGGGGLL